MEQNDKTPTPLSAEEHLFHIRNYIKDFFKDALDLESGVDKRATIHEIKNKKSMSGANAWMLMCSIVIASVGLDMDSPAVIIGAMLISPLMSPILGMGLAVGINDKETLKSSLAHFSMAVAIALITSTIYFSLTPLGELTGQISARTEPGPLDIFIAFFGGIAGIVSFARKDISTTIPGVAIATALMPPICVTGYGIATGHWDIALTSFFLFFINTVFVSFATYIIVRFVLHFPQKDFADSKEKRKNTYYIVLFLISIAVISYFPFRKLLKDRKNHNQVEEFVTKVFGEDKMLLDSKVFISEGDSNLLVLKVYGDGQQFRKDNSFKDLLTEIGLKNTKVQIITTTNINKQDLQELDNKINGIKDVSNQLDIVKNQNSENDLFILQLKSEINSLRMDSTKFEQICAEVRSLVPEVESLSYSQGQSTDFTHHTSNTPIVIIDWKKQGKSLSDKQNLINSFLKVRLEVDTIRIVHVLDSK